MLPSDAGVVGALDKPAYHQRAFFGVSNRGRPTLETHGTDAQQAVSKACTMPPKPGHKFTAVFKVTDKTDYIDLDLNSSNMILATPRVERTEDGHLKRVPLELHPSAVMVKGKPRCIDDTSMRSLQHIIVRARLTVPGSGTSGFHVPPAGTWCTVPLHGPGAVTAGHTLDKNFIK